ncbi:hypothetical protein H310_12149 [Aphanomyces invadans]|uniref:Tc1-like transposase DDE domain-containing protein n=1 Tax=Aphanomyces invadans TaxID=157072 RepID=A0A024TJH6_9STRA|nr:hypothetical protein H310_12149 [Aphanomyces invadans]ETV94149.1 hypothetical protein H310_12149 [Aphanomyces invadans]|eukprot:XP_008877352.1 hypothetical protein H310_12149 [Aphanomyces invadans]
MWDVVLLDEKWFNADKDCRKEYLLEGEEVPRRACKSKGFITKVMFLCAVARPQMDIGVDEKIGLWPFVSQSRARRSSRNRPAGSMVITTLINVDATTYRDYVLNKVVPAIKASLPCVSKRVVLQHDNATPHRSVDDDALAGVSTDGWTFVVRRQPPNSPDLNVLDLGFFASIQSLQHKMVSRTVDDVISSTLMVFDMLSGEKLEDLFLTYIAGSHAPIPEHAGDNHFKLPHLKKDGMRRAGTLAVNLTVLVSLLFEANSPPTVDIPVTILTNEMHSFLTCPITDFPR